MAGADVPEGTIPVFDHGFVRLDDAMASDLSVVNAARVSFARGKQELEAEDEGLIGFLLRNRHGSPFEHNAFRFHVRCPIFVMREWIRHRWSSFNEFSMRYSRASDDFYLPAAEDVRQQVGKPGSYSFEPVDPAKYSAALAAGINRVALEPLLSEDFGRAGRRRVEDHFSWAAIERQTVDLYRSLLRGGQDAGEAGDGAGEPVVGEQEGAG